MSAYIDFVSSYWNGSMGEHPRLVPSGAFYSFPPKLDAGIEEHLLELDLPLIPCVDGHNVMVESGISQYLEIDFKFCLSPNFARDLAGRTIYLGYGPEQKTADEWPLDRRCTFPNGCRPMTPDIGGSELIENVFLTRFRCLDSSTSYASLQDLVTFSYDSANLYPYKLRLDTFYQDGWRLPQTEYLYVNSNADGSDYAAKIEAIWQQMSAEGYQAFYQKINESGALEAMMVGGCSLIPTFEGSNGHYKVAEDYTITGRWPGKAVVGLHDVQGVVTSDAPKNTIVDVLAPGYVTKHGIKPAQVIVSDGRKYESIQRSLGYAAHPDIRLPHPRSCARWAETWLPTLPHHFNAAAIWGWDDKDGRFIQQWGPLWDPLHYYYASVDEVVRAFKERLPQSRTMAAVPVRMKNRFYPVVPMHGFDMMNEKLLNMRMEKDILPKSGIQRVNDHNVHAGIGYHPLPLLYEYELAPDAFPELMPNLRRVSEKPSQLRVVPVVQPTTSASEYRSNAPDVNEHERLTLPTMTRDSVGDPLVDYPQLNRYLSQFNAAMAENLSPVLAGMLSEKAHLSGALTATAEETGIAFYHAAVDLKQNAITRAAKILQQIADDPKREARRYWRGGDDV